MNRTPQEILARIEAVKNSDWLGTITNDLVVNLSFEDAKPLLKPEATADGWKKETTEPKARILDYLPFAWDKANNCRGISAGRSLDHMKAWLWLDGQPDELLNLLDDYEYYGKPQLVMCSELVGFDWRSVDSGDWCNSEDGPALSPAERDRLAATWAKKAAPAVAAA